MINRFGLFVQANGGSGDSTHRSGIAVSLMWLLGDKTRAAIHWALLCQHCEIKPGIWIRHPSEYEGDWSAYPEAFSRDQASRVILAAAVLGDKVIIKRWLKQMTLRGFLHQNNLNPVEKTKRPRDIMAPGEWRNVIRGLSCWYLYPLLLLLDATFITDILTRSIWDGGSLFMPDLFYAQTKYPTPFSYICLKWAKRTTIASEIQYNHSLEKNGCVELQPLFERCFSKF